MSVCAHALKTEFSINYHCAVILYISARLLLGVLMALLHLMHIKRRARRLEECKCITIRYAFCSDSLAALDDPIRRTHPAILSCTAGSPPSLL